MHESLRESLLRLFILCGVGGFLGEVASRNAISVRKDEATNLTWLRTYASELACATTWPGPDLATATLVTERPGSSPSARRGPKAESSIS